MKKILIVDNSLIILKYMKDLLKEEGHEVLTAETGLIALDVLKEYRPDIIFLDLIMPNLPGEKVCQIIRKRPEIKNTYLVILSAAAAEMEIDIAKIGADACIAKGPFNKMRKYIFDAIEYSELLPADRPDFEVMGIEDVYRREITEELLESRNHLAELLKTMSEGVLEITKEGRIVSINAAAQSVFGMPEEKLLTEKFINLFNSADSDKINKYLNNNSIDKSLDYKEVLIKHNTIDILISKNKLNMNGSGSMLIILKDVTDYRKTLAEKTLLLEELHHRVKNNFAMIIGLINLQSEHLKDKQYSNLIQILKARIQSLSILHDKLYQTDNFANIDFKNYITDVFDNLTLSFTDDTINIKIHQEIDDSCFTINTAVPIALIITELVTNSFKYAFPDNRKGDLFLSLKAADSKTCRLIIKDNGIGLPDNISGTELKSLGLKLVYTLTEQIAGSIEIDRNKGTKFTITFPKN